MSRLVIQNRQRVAAVDARLLRRLVDALLREELGIADFDLGINLVGARAMARLNETFLRHAGSTDVITFDYAEGGPLHGEIFICLDEAIAQARRFRTTWPGELARYAIHGILHLQGHDDRRAADRRKMKRAENRLLKQMSRSFPLRKLSRASRLPA